MVSSVCLLFFLVLIAALSVFSDESPTVTITGPAPFTTNGTKTMTLKGEARGMTGSPVYSWGGLCSSNTDTCTLRPQPEENGEIVICTATDRITKDAVTGGFLLNLTFPPKLCNGKENDQPQELTQEGLNIYLIANPVPHSFSYSRYPGKNVTTDSTQLDRVFNTACSRINDTHVLCELHLSHGNNSEEYSGLFNLELSNDIGPCTLSFEVKQKVLSPNEQDSPKMGTGFRIYAVVLSVLMGVTLIMVVVTVVIGTTFARWNPAHSEARDVSSNCPSNRDRQRQCCLTDPGDCQPTVPDFSGQQDGGDKGRLAQDPCNDFSGQQDGGDEGLSSKDPGNDFPGQQDGGDEGLSSKDPGNDFTGQQDGGDEGLSSKDPGNDFPGQQDGGDEGLSSKDPGNDFPGQQDGRDGRFSNNKEPDDVFKQHTTDQTSKLTLPGDEFSDDSLC